MSVTSERFLDQMPTGGLDTLDLRRLSEAPGDGVRAVSEGRHLTLVEAGLGSAKGRYHVEFVEQPGTCRTARSWRVAAESEAGRALGHVKVEFHDGDRPHLTGEITLAVSGRAAVAGNELLAIGTRRLLGRMLERMAHQLEAADTGPHANPIDAGAAREDTPGPDGETRLTRTGCEPLPSVRRSLVLAGGVTTMTVALVVWFRRRVSQ